MEIRKVLNQIIEEFNESPPDIDGTGNPNGQKKYLNIMKDSYLITLERCLNIFDNRKANICELGSFLGIVSKSLKHFGHDVIACDIPYFYNRQSTKNYFKKSSIKSLAFNLRNYEIPILTSSQDLVIACEIIEHLNFNPLPIIKEINRILKVGGYFYIATPNSNSLVKKLRFLFLDKQPSFTVKQFFQQLDSSQNMIVGLHWREYSNKEILEMVLPFGFELCYKNMISDIGYKHGNLLKKILKKVIFLLPGCKPNQVLLFRKINDANLELDINNDS